MSYSIFQRESLEAHNQYRAKHGCAPLKLNATMCKFSTEWAERLAQMGVMQHRSNNKYGENIYMAMGCEVAGKDAVKSWYDEKSKYNYNNGGFAFGTGHFTQVVWKDSRELGVGVAKRGSTTYVVANYDPPGNFQGRFQENVLREVR